MYTLTQHFRSPDWTGKVEDQYVTEREALDAYADASWAYAHAPDGPRNLILRTVDGDDTLSITEHPCVDARALLATLATGRVVQTSWCGSTLEADVSVV
jgi:hypothetical protein